MKSAERTDQSVRAGAIHLVIPSGGSTCHGGGCRHNRPMVIRRVRGCGLAYDDSSGMARERGSIADKPDMPERIGEPALAMCAPRRRMVSDVMSIGPSAGLQRSRDDGIWIVAEQF